jgi:hypothetical protein
MNPLCAIDMWLKKRNSIKSTCEMQREDSPKGVQILLIYLLLLF